MKITSLRLLNITGLTYKKIVSPTPPSFGGAYLLTQNGLDLLTQDNHRILVRGKNIQTQDNRLLLTQDGNTLLI